MGAEIYNPQECFFFQLDAEDEQLRQLLTDDSNSSCSKGELTQLIHHAYTYGANKTVLLVGSNNILMYCVVIKFSTTLLQSYDCIVSMMYDKYFSFLYAPELKPSTFPKEKVEMALGAHSDGEKKSDMVSWHSFITNYHLWQAINIKPDRRAIQFPLPPMDRFLPCQNAEWNLSKGPSDTLTSLFDDCKENISIRDAQTVAVARLLSVSCAAFHCCMQILNAKEDLSFYQTLDNFRKLPTIEPHSRQVLSN